jgi:small subunit ribosomal protein S1
MSISVQEDFAQLIDQSIASMSFAPNALLKAKVLKIQKDYITVMVVSDDKSAMPALKSEALIPAHEFFSPDGSSDVKIDDFVEVVLESPDNGFGEPSLSRDKAIRARLWVLLSESFDNELVVQGKILERVNGGMTVDVNGIKAFLPGSLLDVRPVKNMSSFEGQMLDFKIVKMDQARNNIVVSRKAVLEEENSEEREKLFETMEDGQVREGVVKNLTDYGAFVDLGGIDGLLHITDISWKRLKHPGEMINVGDAIKVKVLSFDKDKRRVSLGIKQLQKDPWEDIKSRYPEETKIKGKVTNIIDYGCFVEIEDGIEGLVHVSEMDWTNKNIRPSKMVQTGDEVEVMILDIDEKRRRISLGLKHCIPNPWFSFAEKYQKGDRVVGNVKSTTDFGIFVGLDGNIDGLVHINDIAWDKSGEQAIRDYKKNDTLDSIILGIDVERERISLGLKQLKDDPFEAFLSAHPSGEMVSGKVLAIESGRASLDLSADVKGSIRLSEFDEQVKVGDTVEAYVSGVDKKAFSIALSVKPYVASDDDRKESAKEKKTTAKAAPKKATIGDLLKQQMGSKDESEDK